MSGSPRGLGHGSVEESSGASVPPPRQQGKDFATEPTLIWVECWGDPDPGEGELRVSLYRVVRPRTYINNLIY